jgi:ABC-type polysaccharide/polyol phosphate export permease
VAAGDAEMGTVRELWRYRDVLYNFVRRDIKKRYKSSILGFLWSFLLPLAQVVTFVIVFGYFWPVKEDDYSVKLMTCFFPWLFFNQGVLDGASCVAEHVALVKRIYFPRLVLPLTSLGSNVIHFLLSLVVLAAYFAYVGVTVNWPYLPLVGLALCIQIVFMFGLMLIVSALSVFYSDVKFLLSAVFQMWFFLTPVLYSAEKLLGSDRLSGVAKQVYFLNPLAPLMMGYRSVVPQQEPTAILPHYNEYLAISAAVAVLTLAVGYVIFRRYEWEFALQG